jgi:biotin carboxyl carrier protein
METTMRVFEPGIVWEIHARPGDRVEAGQLLAAVEVAR